MLLILFLLIVPVLVYGLRAAMRKRDDFTKVAKVSRLVFLSFAFLFVGLLAIENFNYYLIGYRSNSIVYLIATTAGIVYAFSDRRFILNSVKRTLLNLIAVTFMMGSAFLVVELIGDYEKQLVYSDSKFRLEFTGRAPMSPCGLPALFVKKGIVERKGNIVTSDTCISKTDILSVTIKEIDSSYLVQYVINNGTGNGSHLITVKYYKP